MKFFTYLIRYFVLTLAMAHAPLFAMQSKDKQNHAPLLMLIDQAGIENPFNGVDGLEALTLTLQQILFFKPNFPIFVSSSTFFNLITRTGLGTSETPLSSYFNKKDWLFYDVPSSQFFLLVPKKYLETNPNHGLRLNELPNLTNLLPEPKEDFSKFLQEATPYFAKGFEPFKVADLSKIFVDKKDNKTLPIFDIWILGHGQMGTTIVDLSIEQVNEVLRFFDLHINAGVILLQSCYVGGINSNLLQFKETGVAITHNYILVVDGITDSLTYTYFNINKIINDFFNNAANLKDKGDSLSRLLKDLNIFHENSGSPHGAENIPQVWLPNGLGFQTFNIDERILVIGNVLAKIHEENRSPIIIKNKEAVLLYPIVINAPVHVGLSPTQKTENLINLWQSLPTINDLRFNKIALDEKLIKIFPSLNNVSPQSLTERRYLLFPVFIPINIAGNKFNEVKLNSSLFPHAGILHFLRDSFLSMPERETQSIYTSIDRLTGYNDISLTLALTREFREKELQITTEQNPLEKDLLAFADKEITIEKVEITSTEENFSIAFIVNNKAWILTDEDLQESNYWNFKEFPLDTHLQLYSEFNEYLSEKSGQKSISEVLKQKQQDILRKKAALSEKQKIITETLAKQEEMRKKAALLELQKKNIQQPATPQP